VYSRFYIEEIPVVNFNVTDFLTTTSNNVGSNHDLFTCPLYRDLHTRYSYNVYSYNTAQSHTDPRQSRDTYCTPIRHLMQLHSQPTDTIPLHSYSTVYTYTNLVIAAFRG